MNFQLARTNMVAQQVRPWSVTNEEVLKILSLIPRESFVPSEYLHLAYSDTDIPLANNQTMLPPKIVGRALQALKLTGQEKVLEVGTGTGYVTACLAKLSASVVSVEIDSTLFTQAEKYLAPMQYRHLILEQGDGVFGFEKYAPYDAILITGSYPLGVPQGMMEQLKITGRMFAITGLWPNMKALIIERQEKTNYITRDLFETVVPALVHAPQPKKFQF